MANGFNATVAYKAAYPSVKNDNVAAAAAQRLLRNVQVAAYIKKLQSELAERNQLKADDIIQELRALAFGTSMTLLKPATS